MSSRNLPVERAAQGPSTLTPAEQALELGPGESSDQRVALFVDSQNLFYAARDVAGRNVDYEQLLAIAVRGRRLQAATAYVVEREGESTAYGFVARLSTIGYRVRRRHVRVHRADEHGRTVLEGDWDMSIAADIVRAIDHVDVIVLASGDGDFVPILELVQQRGRRVEAIAFKEAAANALIDLVDRFVHLGEIEEALMPANR